MPDDEFERSRERRILHAGDRRARRRRIGEQRDRDHQARDPDEAENGRGTHVRALLGEAGINARAFDADEDEHRDEHRIAHLRDEGLFRHSDAAEEILRELRIVEEKDEDEDRHDQRNNLGDGDDRVDEGRLLDAPQDHEMERPDADQRHDNRCGVGAIPENFWKEPAERRGDEHPVEGVAEATAEPVAEGRQEADIVAKARLRVGEDAGVDVRPLLRQSLEHARQHVHAGARDRPCDEGAEGARRRREPAGKVEDARPDHRADDHRGERGKRKFF